MDVLYNPGAFINRYSVYAPYVYWKTGVHKNATPETNVNILILIKIDKRSIYVDFPEVIRNYTAWYAEVRDHFYKVSLFTQASIFYLLPVTHYCWESNCWCVNTVCGCELHQQQ